MLVDILSWVATICSLFGQVLINNKRKTAFPVWVLANLTWIAVNILGTFNLANVIMYVIYTIMNIVGFIKWAEKPREEGLE